MRNVFIALVALLVAASMPGQGMAQGKQPGPLPSTPGEGAAAPGADSKMIEGKIKSVDATGRRVTLEDGTQLQIPDSVKVPRDSLKQGAMVRATYEEKAGQKVVTTIEVHPRS